MSTGSRSMRTQRQQEQNKQAQQRYRARKKQKAVQMESQVVCMQQQMAELQRVMRHNVSLQVVQIHWLIAIDKLISGLQKLSCRYLPSIPCCEVASSCLVSSHVCFDHWCVNAVPSVAQLLWCRPAI